MSFLHSFSYPMRLSISHSVVFLIFIFALSFSHSRRLPTHQHHHHRPLVPALDGHLASHEESGKIGHSDFKFKYHSKRTQHVVHQLDDFSPSLLEWDCSSASLSLRFRSKDLASALDIHKGHVITGTNSWDCGQSAGGLYRTLLSLFFLIFVPLRVLIFLSLSASFFISF